MGLQFICKYPGSTGSINTLLTKPDRRSLKRMFGDGSCLFKSFSFIVTGTQDQHTLVRSHICDHMLLIEDILFQYGHLSTEHYSDYLQKSGMRNPYEWGTNIEIFTFAYMCQTDIYVFGVENNHWTAYIHSR